MDVTLRDLGYFVALAGEQHLTRAAKRLNIAPATLSEAIKRLERITGVNLFERAGRTIEVSSDGIALLRHAEKVLAAANDFTAIAASRGDTERPILKVGSVSAYGSTWILDASDHIDGLEVQLLATGLEDPTAGLANDEAEVAVLIGPTDLDAEFESRLLGLDDRLAILSTSHPLANRSSVALHELDAIGWLALPPTDDTSGRYWRAEPDRPGPPPKIARQCKTNQDLALAVLMGEGVCMMPGGLGRHVVLDGLTIVAIQDLEPVEIRLAYRPQLRPSSELEHFFDRVTELANAELSATATNVN